MAKVPYTYITYDENGDPVQNTDYYDDGTPDEQAAPYNWGTIGAPLTGEQVTGGSANNPSPPNIPGTNPNAYAPTEGTTSGGGYSGISDISGDTSTSAGAKPSSWDNVLNYLKTDGKYDPKKIAGIATAIGGIDALTGGNLNKFLSSSTGQPVGYLGGIPKYEVSRERKAMPKLSTADILSGGAQSRDYFGDTKYVKAAGGGLMPGDIGVGYAAGGRTGRYLQGATDGMADDLPAHIDGNQPAALSHGEFVIPADVVSHLGNGNSDAGAKKLYAMMDKIRMARTGTKKQGKQINPDKFMPGGLAKLAAGGGVRGFAAGGDTTTVPTGANGIESSLSNWAGPYVTDMLGKADALASKPYEAYQGTLSAGASDLQKQGFQQASGLSTPASIGQSAATAGNIASKAQGLSYSPTSFGNQFTAPGAYQASNITAGNFDTSAAQKYMNPYLAAALNPQLDELRRQSQITQMGNDAKMVGAGAFGGDRQALLTSENQRNMLNSMESALGTGYKNAYDAATAQFNADQNRGVDVQKANEQSRQFGAGQAMTGAQSTAQYGLAAQQAAEQSKQFGANYGLQGLNTALQATQTQGNMGVQQNQAGINNLDALMKAGSTQRDITQQGITADINAFNEARDNPYKMLQFKQSMLQGLPITAQQYNQAQPSLMQQLAGMGATGAQISDFLNAISGNVKKP